MTDVKHTRANKAKPGRREITIANDLSVSQTPKVSSDIDNTVYQLKEINMTLLLILQQLQYITGEDE